MTDTKFVACRLSERDYNFLKKNKFKTREAIEYFIKEYHKTNPMGLLVRKKELKNRLAELKKKQYDTEIELKSVNECIEEEKQKRENLGIHDDDVKKAILSVKESYERMKNRNMIQNVLDLPHGLLKTQSEKCDLTVSEFKKIIEKEIK